MNKLPTLLKRFISMTAIVAWVFSLAAFLPCATCQAEEGDAIFSVDANKQKADIDKYIDKVDELLASLKFQDARSAIDLVNHKLDRAKKDLAGEDIQAFRTRIEKAKKTMSASEDSLVNKTFDILKAQGADSALFYTQTELRGHGVSENKISAAEKRVLEEGPAIKQAKEKEAVDKTVKLLEAGKTPSPGTDAFILQSAERIIKMHEEAKKTEQTAKAKKDFEERQRLADAQREKEAKEKKLEEQKLAKQIKEAEKKRRDAEESEKKRLALDEARRKKLEEQQEKSLKDSIEAAQKVAKRMETIRKESLRKIEEAQFEHERLARKEQEEQKKSTLNQQEKSLKDSLNEQRKVDEKESRRIQEEKEKSAQEEKERRDKAQLAQEQARKDSVEVQRKEIEKRHMEDEREEMARSARLDNDKQKKIEAVQQEQSHKDSIEAQRKNDEWTTQQRKKMFAIQEKARKDSIETQRKTDERAAQQRKQMLAMQEKARKDSVEAQRKQSARKDKERMADKDGGASSRLSIGRSDSAEAHRWGSIQTTKQDKMLEQQEKERLARLIEEERQRKVVLAQQKEKARKDSVEAQHKTQEQLERQRKFQEEKDKLVRESEERQKKLLIAQREKTIKDSLESQRKTQEQSSREQKNRGGPDKALRVEEERMRKLQTAQREQSADSIDAQRKVKDQKDNDAGQDEENKRLVLEVQKEKERLAGLEEQLRRHSIAKQGSGDAQPRETQPETPASTRDEEARKAIAQRDEHRTRHITALQEKARQEYQKKFDEAYAKIEKERQRRAQSAPKIPDSTTAQGKNVRINVDIDKTAANYDNAETTTSPQASSPPSSGLRDNVDPPKMPLIVPLEDPKLKDKRAIAEKSVTAIYKLVEKNKIKDAQSVYKRNRDFIVQYSDPEVIGALEQTLTQSTGQR
jgi:hypothetical protein